MAAGRVLRASAAGGVVALLAVAPLASAGAASPLEPGAAGPAGPVGPVALDEAGALVPAGAEVAAATSEVEVVDNAFEPGTVEVVVGDTVRWRQTGTNPHSVTADDESFDSHPSCFPACMAAGDTFEHTFDEAGTYPYFCRVHGSPGGNGMSGVVVVSEASAAGTGGPPAGPPPGGSGPGAQTGGAGGGGAPAALPTATATAGAPAAAGSGLARTGAEARAPLALAALGVAVVVRRRLATAA